MAWTTTVLPFLIKLLGYLVPAIGGAIGGPLGWIVTLILSSLSKMAADMATKALEYGAIEEALKLQVDALNVSAQAFFEIETKREKGELVTKEKRDAAKAQFKKDAKALINFKSNSSAK
jgi:hypothetical protein